MPRGRTPIPLKFARVPHPTMAQPCIVPTSHKPDDKGYMRVVPRAGKTDRARPLHRTAYMAKHGPDSIPDGWEIDHICQNRACCNRKHLRAIHRSDHKRITAMMRYADRNERARCHWLYYQSSPAELAELFGVKPDTVRGWIKRWREDPDEF